MQPDDSAAKRTETPRRRRLQRGPAKRPEGAAWPDDLLKYDAGRGPVQDSEALLMLQDRELRAAALAHRDPQLPSELPAYDAGSNQTVLRLTDRAVLQAMARAHIEGTNLSTVVDVFLLRYGRGVPEDPAAVERQQLETYAMIGLVDPRLLDEAHARRELAQAREQIRILTEKLREQGGSEPE